MKYAPVVIPTLNRFQHLKRCLESLEYNKLFLYTEIYISLDYPPSEKYIEGYKKVKGLLHNKCNKYKNIHVITQTINLGAFNNCDKLQQIVFEKYNYDSIIVLEDDVQLSPNFLEYCNVLLDKYKNNEDIVGICGSSQVWYGENFKDEYNKNHKDVIRLMPLVWHGFATWKKNYYEIKKLCENKYFENIKYNFFNLLKLRKKSLCFFYCYIDRVCWSKAQLPWYNNKIVPIDMTWDIYMMVNDKYVIYPVINKVLDLGMDGTGVNFTSASDNMNKISHMHIDDANDFILDSNDLCIDMSEVKKHDKYTEYNLYYIRFKVLIKLLLSYFIKKE